MNGLSLLDWKDAVELKDILLDTGHVQLILATQASFVLCPLCGHSSNCIHSRYSCCLADLPCAGKPMKIILHVRRFFCDNNQCLKQTFAEQVSGVATHARQTMRLQHQLVQIAGQLGGRAGAKLASFLGMPVGHHTLL